LVELEFGDLLSFVEGGKPDYLVGKTPWSKATNSTHIWHSTGVEPGPYW